VLAGVSGPVVSVPEPVSVVPEHPASACSVATAEMTERNVDRMEEPLCGWRTLHAACRAVAARITSSLPTVATSPLIRQTASSPGS
jgi:hypothetical protein